MTNTAKPVQFRPAGFCGKCERVIMPISETDSIGDARVSRGYARWRNGDKVQWESISGWRGGVIAGLHGGYATVVDYDRRRTDCVAVSDLRRVVPRDDAGNAKG